MCGFECVDVMEGQFNVNCLNATVPSPSSDGDEREKLEIRF